MSRPDTPATGSATGPRYPSLDLWRGVACLLVVTYHSSYIQPAPAGGSGSGWAWASYAAAEVAHRMWVGVPMFFVISGYCIAATADSSRRKSHGFVMYAARRVRRIYPPYWICFGVTAVVVGGVDLLVPRSLTGPGLIIRPWWLTPSQWFGNLTLTELWRPRVFGDQYSAFLLQSWSLVYEEQFYLVMGLLLVFARRYLFAAAAAVTLACPIGAAVCRQSGVTINGFFFDGGWTLFACGILVYYALNVASRAGRAAAAGVLLAGLAYSLRDPAELVTEHYPPEGSFYIPTTFLNFDLSLFVATGFALVILLGRRWDDWLTSRGWLRPVFWCGTMCYSLYLVHAPVVALLHAGARQLGVDPTGVTPFVTIPVGVTASVAVSWVFFQVVERRFLNSGPGVPSGLAGRPPADAVSAQPAERPAAVLDQAKPAPAV